MWALSRHWQNSKGGCDADTPCLQHRDSDLLKSPRSSMRARKIYEPDRVFDRSHPRGAPQESVFIGKNASFEHDRSRRKAQPSRLHAPAELNDKMGHPGFANPAR